MPKFRFLPEIAPAGIAFEAFGKTERQLLENSALALEETIVDTKTIRSRTKETVNLRDLDFSQLLLAMLEHLIFLKKAKQFVFKEIKLGVERENKSWILQGFAYGEKIDPARHKLRVDVKGLIKDLFEVSRKKSGAWRAQVILDI